jgi:hypothetical protein
LSRAKKSPTASKRGGSPLSYGGYNHWPTKPRAAGRDRLEVTALGRLLVRIVAMAFDAYLPAAGAAQPGSASLRTI